MRPEKNHRRREDGEAPKGKKLSKHGCKLKCGLCRNTGHKKAGYKKNPEKGNKNNSHLQKAGKKIKATEVPNFTFLLTENIYFHFFLTRSS